MQPREAAIATRNP